MTSITNINYAKNLNIVLEHALYNVNSINILLKNGFVPNSVKLKKLCYSDVIIQMITGIKHYTKEEQKSIINLSNNIFSL